MVERIGKDSALAREALAAALRRAPERAPVAAQPAGAEGPAPASAPDFARALEDGLERVDERVKAADELPLDLLGGKVSDFHEIAVQLKSAELSFRFAMEIRNKLVDAYREVMRMNV